MSLRALGDGSGGWALAPSLHPHLGQAKLLHLKGTKFQQQELENTYMTYFRPCHFLRGLGGIWGGEFT